MQNFNDDLVEYSKGLFLNCKINTRAATILLTLLVVLLIDILQ